MEVNKAGGIHYGQLPSRLIRENAWLQFVFSAWVAGTFFSACLLHGVRTPLFCLPFFSIPHPTNTQSCFSQFVVNPRSPISILLLPSMSPSGAAIDPGEGNPSRIHAQRIQTSGFLFLAKWSNSNRLPVRCRTGIWRCLPGQVRRWSLHCLRASTFTRLTPH